MIWEISNIFLKGKTRNTFVHGDFYKFVGIHRIQLIFYILEWLPKIVSDDYKLLPVTTVSDRLLAKIEFNTTELLSCELDFVEENKHVLFINITILVSDYFVIIMLYS